MINLSFLKPASFQLFTSTLTRRPTYLLAGAALCFLASCQQSKTVSSSESQEAVTTELAARTAVANYLKAQSNANLYVVDSARVAEDDAQWQVLVPRTDWSERMPNRAAFEVDKRTGKVRTLMVK